MTNSRNIPKRRFPYFEGEWVDFEFKSLLDSFEGIRRGPFGSALKKEFFVPTSEYVVYEQNNAIYNTWDTRYYINYEKFKELEKFKVLPGDFLLSGAGTIGKISQVPKGVKQGVFNQALIRLRINKSFVDENFFLIWIQSDRMQEKLTDANPGSAMTNLVPMSELKKWIVSIPKKEEQVRVSHFIFKINNLIALHQHKLEKLKNLKKAYLAELFPAEGERVPKRRFPGFEGEWEEKRIGEILETLPYKQFMKEPASSGDFEVIQQGHDPVIGFANGSPCNDFEDVVIFGDHTLSLYKPQKPFFVATDGVRILNGKNSMNGYYLYVLLERFKPKNEGYKRYFGILTDVEVSITNNIAEQERIALLFQQIDKTITLHQQKLDKLKDLKKAYLNELFV